MDIHNVHCNNAHIHLHTHICTVHEPIKLLTLGKNQVQSHGHHRSKRALYSQWEQACLMGNQYSTPDGKRASGAYSTSDANLC